MTFLCHFTHFVVSYRNAWGRDFVPVIHRRQGGLLKEKGVGHV